MGKDDIKRQVAAAAKKAMAKTSRRAGQSSKGRHRPARAFPFKVEKGQVWRQVEKDNDDGTTRKHWVSFCSEINVLALTRNEDGQEWGRLLEVVDRDDNRHLWAMPLSLTAGYCEGLRAELLGLGLELSPGQKAKQWLLEYLISADPARRAWCVSHIGWHGDIYVLPNETIGADEAGDQVILQSSERLDHAFNIGGTLANWKKDVAGPALGNSRLILAISAAFAAPMLALSGDEGGGFHLRGASSSGKSTALIVAGSVWGGGGTRGYVRQWRATDNALESIAALSCDTLLCLDELSQVDAKAAATAAYMLANGKGKARAGRAGQARKVLEWRVLFLSSGEIALADKIKEGGGRIAAGMEVRVIDVRADAGTGMGLFEDIHGANNAAEFAQDLKRAATANFGQASRALVSALAADVVGLREEISERRRLFIDATRTDDADGQVRRVADRFALLAAAGDIATTLNLTGWPTGTAHNTILRCFMDWLQDRGGIGAGEVAEARRRIAEAVQVHGNSRFQHWAKNGSERMLITNRLGFVKRDSNPNQEGLDHSYFFMPEPLKNLLTGLDFRTIIAALMDEQVIVPQNGKPTKPFHVPTFGRKQRLYEINTDALYQIVSDGDS